MKVSLKGGPMDGRQFEVEDCHKRLRVNVPGPSKVQNGRDFFSGVMSYSNINYKRNESDPSVFDYVDEQRREYPFAELLRDILK